jgi:P-type Cu2+ transporter
MDHEKMGTHAGRPMNQTNHQADMAADFRRRFWISLGVTIPILILSPVIQHFLGLGESIRFAVDTYILFGLSSAVFLYGGYPFLKGFIAELRSRTPGMMTLVAVATSVAYFYSYAVTFGLPGSVFFWELATLIDIMLLGHWLEMRSVMGASNALEQLARLMPASAHKLNADGAQIETPVDQLMAGDRVLVKPGEKVPADGEVLSGESSVDESLLTGESQPIHKANGDKVIEGSVNSEGALTVEVQKTGADSYLAQITALVKEAQSNKSRTQLLADRAAMWLVLVAIGGGVLTLALWLSLSRMGISFALERMVTVMVITCPHALGLAVPLAVAVSTSLAARQGLLIRDRGAFERVREVGAVIFDKTGTLTTGHFGITDIVAFSDGWDEAKLRLYAASVESYSEHPIARVIAASEPGRIDISDFRSIPGSGATARVEGKSVMVVSPSYASETLHIQPNPRILKLESQGKTVVLVLVDDKPIGVIALADILRPESRAAILRLKDMGIRCIMLTGDNPQSAAWVSREVELDEYFAEVLPDRKAAKVKEVQSRGVSVAMVGDGVNDAPALAQADVGIAIGAGTEVAIAAAGIILVRSDPRDVVKIIQLSRATYAKMRQNLFWATGYNLAAIPLAAGVLYRAGVLLSPAVGALLMSMSTVIVAFNSRSLKLTKAEN